MHCAGRSLSSRRQRVARDRYQNPGHGSRIGAGLKGRSEATYDLARGLAAFFLALAYCGCAQ
jgi:hypothetical protein